MIERFGQDLILLEKLASGGMAEVYRAKQMGYGGFEKTVALKRILPHYAANDEFKQMFRMEANLSGLLQHSNIAQVFGNGEFDGYLYLLMEFIDGKNVRQLLARADKRKVKLPIDLSCYIVSEVAKGLEYAHNFHDEKNQPLEIVHRDMSPQNVMLGYEGGVKIVDFGIAKAAARTSHTRAGVLKGKFGYMSPEQASGMPIDRRTDVFALGIILFELLTQRRLFTSDEDLKTLQLVKECRVPRPSKYNPDVNPALDLIVLKALKKDRAERYGNAVELYTDLVRFLNQHYPKFLPTDLSNSLRDLFADDMVEEKKRREKHNAEIPARLKDLPPAAKKRPPSGDTAATISGSGATPIDVEGPTALAKAAPDAAARLTPPPATVELTVSQPGIIGKGGVDGAIKLPPPPPQSLKTKTGQTIQISGHGLKLAVDETRVDENAYSPNQTASRSFRMMVANRSRRRQFLTRAALAVGFAALGVSAYFYREPAPTEVAQAPAVPVAPKIAPPPFVAPPPPAVVLAPPPPVAVAAPEPVRQPTSLPPVLKGPGGYLELNSTPRSTEIYVNGVLLRDPHGQALQTPLSRKLLPVGTHRIVLKNTFYGVQWAGTVKVEKDKLAPLDVLLK